jgi:hypothetical protein
MKAKHITINETYELKDGRQCVVKEADDDGYFLVRILDDRFDERLLAKHCRDFKRNMEWGTKCDSCGRREAVLRGGIGRLGEERCFCRTCADSFELAHLRTRVWELEQQLAIPCREQGATNE